METIKRKGTKTVTVSNGWKVKDVRKYYIQTIQRGRRSEFSSDTFEFILILLSVLILGVFWLAVYELYQLAHKDEIIERVIETKEITKEEYDNFNNNKN